MVEVAAASFTMGCVSGPAASGCKPDEKPSHSVNVPAFRIDRDEATVAMWSHCVSDGACTLPNQSSALCNYGAAGKEQHPINCISWDQARAFCSWAGKRLCSEAEWELAAVGSDGRTYPWGDDAPTCERAVLDQEEFGCGTGSTFPVGSKPEGDSPYGARDMIGNVWEWVEDFYHDDYENAPSDGSAWLVPATEARVGRGGALSDKAVVLRASVRRSFNLRLDGYYLGVRCCEHVQP
jgi:formylglycine-generating enzyme required for sulfatase activity